MIPVTQPLIRWCLGPSLALTLAVLSAGAIAVEVFLAGLNVFLGPRWWGTHIAFGHA